MYMNHQSRDGVNPAQFDSGYHHHKTQWFHNGKVVSGTSGSGFVYGSRPKENYGSAGKKDFLIISALGSTVSCTCVS